MQETASTTAPPRQPPARRRRQGFIERTLAGLFAATDRAVYAEALAKSAGLLQRLDPRGKVIGLLALVIAAALARNLVIILSLFAIAITLALLSSVPLRMLATRVWLGALLFTGAIALPAIFITPGSVVYRLPWLHWPVTSQGLMSAAYLLARVETAATYSTLLILCTPWTHVLKALRALRVPVIIVVILGMTHRYIFLLLETARDLFDARRSRMVGALGGSQRRRIAVASVGVLLGKSLHLSHEVYLAMRSRGFRGEVFILDEFNMRRRDWVWLVGCLTLAALAFWLGRRG